MIFFFFFWEREIRKMINIRIVLICNDQALQKSCILTCTPPPISGISCDAGFLSFYFWQLYGCHVTYQYHACNNLADIRVQSCRIFIHRGLVANCRIVKPFFYDINGFRYWCSYSPYIKKKPILSRSNWKLSKKIDLDVKTNIDISKIYVILTLLSWHEIRKKAFDTTYVDTWNSDANMYQNGPFLISNS